MRIPYPERIPLSGATVFASLLFAAQQIEGTALYFSAGCVAFILIATLAFNIAGGLTRAAGAYIFFYSLLVVIVGVTYKAYLGEAAQTNLRTPRTDILVYIAGISGMLVAALLARMLRRKTPLLKSVLPERTMFRASVGCIVFGISGGFLISQLGESSQRLNSAFTQLNFLVPLGIIIGVIHEIRTSGGKRSVNMPVLVGACYYFAFFGLISFSKQGMLTPLVCWLIPACALRYRVSALQIISALCGIAIILYLFIPYSQYGRRFIPDNATIGERVDLSVKLLGQPGELRRDYEEDFTVPAYFNKAQGFWDRLTFVSTDDRLNNVTDEGKVFGLYPIAFGFLNVIPHVFWPGKPTIGFGNLYAHEVGFISVQDETTGISFSPTAEAYHTAKWLGVLVVGPLVWLLFFVVYDNVLGDLRSTPWGMLLLVLVAHTAPEGGLVGTITLVTFGLEGILFCAFFAAWVAPHLAVAVLGRVRPVNPLFSTRLTPVRPRRALNTRG